MKNGDRAYKVRTSVTLRSPLHRHSVLEGRGGGLQDIVE
jgi:hypothetical protein